jgi:hypothetical protein
MKVIAPESFGPLGDASLKAIAWEQDGRDLAISVELPGSAQRRFVFTWVDHVQISLVQGEHGPCQPFTWDGDAKKSENGRVCVTLDFASQGRISLECNEISVDD